MDADLASIREARDLLAQAQLAQRELGDFTQAQVDRVVAALAEAAEAAAGEAARRAVEETGCGRVVSKTEKNLISSRDLYARIKDMRTVGVVDRDEARRVYRIASPKGIIAAVCPMTNPVATVFYKALIAIKARCAIVFAPHPRAKKCIAFGAELLARAGERAGLPRGAIGWMTKVSLPGTTELMRHDLTRLILSTGGPSIVKAAYSSGKPALGVGPGNVPAWIDRGADLRRAVREILRSQNFDYGTICASEQSLVIDGPVYEAVLDELRAQKAVLLDDERAERLGRVCMRGGGMSPAVVGQPPVAIARMAGFAVPEDTSALLVPLTEVGPAAPLSREVLAPVLSVYRADGWQEGIKRMREILRYGGMGHTLSIHAQDEKVVFAIAERLPAFRIVINTSSTHGAVGGSTFLFPAMTLGCGAPGNNASSENISPQELLDFKKVAWARDLAVDARGPRRDERGRVYFVGPYNDANI